MQVSSKQWVKLPVESVTVSLPTRSWQPSPVHILKIMLVMFAIVADIS